MKLSQKYRPIELNKKYRIKFRLQTGKAESYNWRSRVRWYPSGWRLNRQAKVVDTLPFVTSFG